MPLAALFPERPFLAVLAVCLCTVASSLALRPFKISPQDFCTCHSPYLGPSVFSHSHGWHQLIFQASFHISLLNEVSVWALSQENASLMIYSSLPFEHEPHPGGDHVYTCISALHCCFLCTWTLAWAIMGTHDTSC